jgi:hypothetical protein
MRQNADKHELFEKLITDQPADPKEERTRFKISPCGQLVLIYEHRA